MKLYCILGEDYEGYALILAWALNKKGIEKQIIEMNKKIINADEVYYMPYIAKTENNTLKTSGFLENLIPEEVNYKETAHIIYKDDIKMLKLRKQQYKLLGLSKDFIEYFKEEAEQ